MNEDDSTHSIVIVGGLHRVRRQHSVAFVAAARPPPVRRPARVAVMLALGHKIQAAIDRGAAPDLAEVARRLGCSRARVTQLVDLTLLAPRIQEALLELEAVDGMEPLNERSLRALVRAGSWHEQWRRWIEVVPPPDGV